MTTLFFVSFLLAPTAFLAFFVDVEVFILGRLVFTGHSGVIVCTLSVLFVFMSLAPA